MQDCNSPKMLSDARAALTLINVLGPFGGDAGVYILALKKTILVIFRTR